MTAVTSRFRMPDREHSRSMGAPRRSLRQWGVVDVSLFRRTSSVGWTRHFFSIRNKPKPVRAILNLVAN